MQVSETERLVIRWLTEEDAAFLFRLYNTDLFIQHIGDKHIRSIDDARSFIHNGPIAMYSDLGFGLYMVERKTNAVPLGICGLIKRETLEDIDIGYAFLPEHFGHGYAYEAARSVVDYASYELKLERLVAITTAGNTRSIHLLEKLGLEFEKELAEQPGFPALAFYAVNFQHPGESVIA